MGNKKGSIFTNEKFSFRGPSKRFIAIISIVAASILFYGFTPLIRLMKNHHLHQ